MKVRVFAGLLLLSLVLVSGGRAQKFTLKDKPVWTMEFLRVKPGMLGPTLGYLDENWMRIREEARRQNAVISYRRLVVQSPSQREQGIVLLTEFTNSNAHFFSDTLFERIRRQLPVPTPGILRPALHDMFDSVNLVTLEDAQDTTM
jgi:hypothetical protein